MQENEISLKRAELLSYTNKMMLPAQELLNMEAEQKLILCQVTPKQVLKDWPLSDWRGWKIKYVPIWYIERCLNFVSNFERGCKVQREWMTEYKYTKPDWKIVTVYDARCLVDFYIVLWNRKIERSCYWSWKTYDNPASSRFNVYEASRSIATKAFADTLWIASDRISKEFDQMRDKIIEAEAVITENTEYKKKLKIYLKKQWITQTSQVTIFMNEKLWITKKRDDITELEAEWICAKLCI